MGTGQHPGTNFVRYKGNGWAMLCQNYIFKLLSCLAQYLLSFYLLYAAGLALSRSKVAKHFPEGQGWPLAIALVGGHHLRPLPPLESYNIRGQNLWDTKATGGESYADFFLHLIIVSNNYSSRGPRPLSVVRQAITTYGPACFGRSCLKIGVLYSISPSTYDNFLTRT